MQRIAAAVDFGGTKVLAGLVDGSGRVLGMERIATPDGGPQAVAAFAGRALAGLMAECGLAAGDVVGLGSTVPGIADRGGRVLRLAPAHGWRDVPFATMLSAETGLDAVIENDVNACALAEQSWGCAQGIRDLLWTTVSTGIGGALVLDSRMRQGPRGLAGEIGHIAVANGPRCGCGRLGCLEAVASGPAIANAARREGLEVEDAIGVFRLADEGERKARAIIDRVHFDLARALSFAANLLDIDLIVLGGGVAQSLDMPKLECLTLERTFTLDEGRPRVRRTELGNEAGLLGAAALVLREQEARP
jgi:glucokinase